MRPFTLLIKPTGPDCNIDCKYCFYSRKTDIFGKNAHRMSDAVAEKLVSSYLKLNLPHSSFAFQGGEPTLMGLDFYKKIVDFQRKYAISGQPITNALQTNAILLDDDWCKFLAENNFLVGISLDGPKTYHDTYRLGHTGKGTFDKVMAAIAKCRQHNVQYNILVLLNNINVTHPDEVWDFFMAQKVKFLQFVQCVENDPDTGKIADFSITPTQYADFMCRIFDRWQAHGVRKVSVRSFDSILSHCLGQGHTECTFMPKCADYIVIEHNGGVYCCDFFVEEDAYLGNIMETPIEKLASSPKKRQFNKRKRELPNKCIVCRHYDICRGGCPKDRRIADSDLKMETFFCDSYKKIFDYTLPKIWQLAAEVKAENPPPGP
ncbi:MAG: anaerobic sulfatase maturase [Planctomycetes bacterium]|nr:anaerobic sulfatase maturase [Planctomycetota bacterium]